MVLLVQEMKDLQRKFHLKLLSEQKGLDNEIKGIKIIEVENMEKYIEGGEILLTSFFIYESCTISQYETHIQNLIDKGVSGFIIKNSGNIKNFNIKLDILKRLCIENEVALFELLRQNYYWDIIRYILDNVFDQEMALLKYHKVTNDNLKEYIFHKEATPKNIIELLYTIIDNPISMYYENLSCLATTYEEKSSFDLLDNIKEYSPEIRLRYNYLKQDAGKYNQYIIPITFIGNIPIKIVIDEKNRKLTNFDFVAIENAIDALRYSFTFDFAKNEIHKKYHRDIFFNLVNSQLNYDDTTEAANMLNLKEDAYYRVVSFHSIPEDQKEKYSLEQLDEVDIIADQISMFYPKDHIYKNVSQIVMLQKMDSDNEDDDSIRRLNELIDIVKKSISKRDQNTNFNIGVGEVVKGYRNLRSSYKQSRVAMKFMEIAKKITGDINKSIVYYSKLGIFQSFIELDDVNKLKKYLTKENITITIVLLVGAIISSVFMFKQVYNGIDTAYHMSRIIGITNSWKAGDLLAYIHLNTSGYGYAMGFFYSNLFMILPSILFMLGMNIILVYKIFILMCSIATVITMYICTKQISKSKYAATISAFLYTTCSYRIITLVVKAFVGEILSFIFIPLIILGLYQLIFEDTKKW